MTVRNQRGFTLIEALIGVLVLGMILLAWLSLEVFTARTVRKVTDFSANQKVLIMIVNDILMAERGLPAENVLPTSPLNRAKIERSELAALFEGPGVDRKFLCYDRRAVLTNVPALCHYRVAYFKYRVRDRRFPGSELENIPLARVLVQVRFKDLSDPENQDADTANDIVQTRYMTRLVSNVADF